MVDSISVLTHDVQFFTKVFSYENGGFKKTSYPIGTFWYRVEEIPLEGIRELHALIELLQNDPHSLCIRGKVAPGANRQHIRARRVLPEVGPQFIEEPRHWLMFDFDHCEWLGPVWDPHSPEAAVRAVIAKLPPYFHDVTCSVHLSASAGFSGPRFHVFFWLDHKVGQTSLDAWAAEVNDRTPVNGGKFIDPALFRTVQLHYTAGPVLGDGVVDPIPEGKRCFLVEGSRDIVSFPVVGEGGSRRDWKRIVARLSDPTNDHIHDHLRNAAAAYFCTMGATADDAPLRAALIAGVEEACRLQHRGDYGEAQIEAEIASGRTYAERMGHLEGSEVERDANGRPMPTPAVLKALLSTPEWDGVWGYDARAIAYQILKKPPIAADAGRVYPSNVHSDDAQNVAVWLNLNQRCHPTKSQVSDAIRALCREHTFDSLGEFLKALPEWDGVERVDHYFHAYYGAEDTAYTREVSRIYLLSAMARALRPGCVCDTMVIIEGLTGRGKSKGIEALFGREFYCSSMADISEREFRMILHGPWVVEIGEVDQHFRRSRDDQSLKSLITDAADRFRAPYAPQPESHPRSSVLVGTTNAEEYLTDVTGGRRYLPVKVSGAQDPLTGGQGFAGVLRDRYQLWAEAKDRVEGCEDWQPRKELLAKVGAEQAARRAEDPLELLIQESLELGAPRGAFAGMRTSDVPRIEAKATEVTVRQILEHVLQIQVPTKTDSTRVGRALTALGWIQKRTNARRWYVRP